MKKTFGLYLTLAMIPGICFGGGDYSSQIQALQIEINNLTRQNDTKVEELEVCMSKVSGFKIGGISTLGLTAIGTGANIGMAVKKSGQQKEKDTLSTKIEKTEVAIDEQTSLLTQIKLQNERIRQENERKCKFNGSIVFIGSSCANGEGVASSAYSKINDTDCKCDITCNEGYDLQNGKCIKKQAEVVPAVNNKCKFDNKEYDLSSSCLEYIQSQAGGKHIWASSAIVEKTSDGNCKCRIERCSTGKVNNDGTNCERIGGVPGGGSSGSGNSNNGCKKGSSCCKIYDEKGNKSESVAAGSVCARNHIVTGTWVKGNDEMCRCQLSHAADICGEKSQLNFSNRCYLNEDGTSWYKDLTSTFKIPGTIGNKNSNSQEALEDCGCIVDQLAARADNMPCYFYTAYTINNAKPLDAYVKKGKTLQCYKGVIVSGKCQVGMRMEKSFRIDGCNNNK